jgi:hypothetical protein
MGDFLNRAKGQAKNRDTAAGKPKRQILLLERVKGG